MLRYSLGLAALLSVIPAPARGVTLEPGSIRIGAAFHGTPLKVSGEAAPATQVFVIITGAKIPEVFNRKGRFGPLWANVGTVTLSETPRLCLIANSTPASELLPRAQIDEHRLDLDAVVKRAKTAPAGKDDELLRREYRRVKESWDAFKVFDRAIRVGGGRYQGELWWPDGAPPGEYAVEVVHLRGAAVVRREHATLKVELVGLPSWIAYLAFERSAVYGAMSVVIALAVGFLMGLVFKKGGSH